MTLTIRNVLIGILAVVLGSYALYAFSYQAYGKITTQNAGVGGGQYVSYDFFASTTAQTNFATTTTATSTNITAWFDSDGRYVDGKFNISGAKNVVMYFSRDAGTGGNGGSTNYKVQVTRDGTTWLDYNTLLQNLATSTDQTSLSSITISAATTTVETYLQNLGFKALRCIVVETTDGSHSCAASAQF